MNKKLLHTPEGVRDIYGNEYAKKLSDNAYESAKRFEPERVNKEWEQYLSEL